MGRMRWKTYDYITYSALQTTTYIYNLKISLFKFNKLYLNRKFLIRNKVSKRDGTIIKISLHYFASEAHAWETVQMVHNLVLCKLQ